MDVPGHLAFNQIAHRVQDRTRWKNSWYINNAYDGFEDVPPQPLAVAAPVSSLASDAASAVVQAMNQSGTHTTTPTQPPRRNPTRRARPPPTKQTTAMPTTNTPDDNNKKRAKKKRARSSKPKAVPWTNEQRQEWARQHYFDNHPTRHLETIIDWSAEVNSANRASTTNTTTPPTTTRTTTTTPTTPEATPPLQPQVLLPPQ